MANPRCAPRKVSDLKTLHVVFLFARAAATAAALSQSSRQPETRDTSSFKTLAR